MNAMTTSRRPAFTWTGIFEKRPMTSDRPVPVTEYYVVDGHHRVAMARKLGQDYLDAHIVEYKLKPGEVAAGGPAASATAAVADAAKPRCFREAEPLDLMKTYTSGV